MAAHTVYSEHRSFRGEKSLKVKVWSSAEVAPTVLFLDAANIE